MSSPEYDVALKAMNDAAIAFNLEREEVCKTSGILGIAQSKMRMAERLWRDASDRFTQECMKESHRSAALPPSVGRGGEEV